MLRGGKLIVGGAGPSDIDDAELIEAMVGAQRRRPARRAGRRSRTATCPRCRCAAWPRATAGAALLLDDVDLDVRAGELVGIAGVAGNGQLELYEVAMGLRRTDVGHRARSAGSR